MQANAALFSVSPILTMVVASAAWMLKSNGSQRLCCKRYDTCLVCKTFRGLYVVRVNSYFGYPANLRTVQ